MLAGIALLGAVAKFNEMPPDTRASLLGDAAEAARVAARSLLPSAVATYGVATGDTAKAPVRVPAVGQGADGENSAPSQIAARMEPLSANPLWALPLNQLSTTRERPIFSPSRRPPSPRPTFVAPVAVHQPVKPPDPERPPVTLLGTIIAAGNDRLGVFVDTATQSILRLRLGEDYQGWVVRLINPREATLVKDGKQAVVLELSLPGTASPIRSSGNAVLDRSWTVGAD